MNTLRVLVTGASGFIGSHLIPALIDRGYTPVAMVRHSSDTSKLDTLGVETRIGDLSDPDSLRSVVTGIDAVVHLAAYYRFYGEKEQYTKINVEGTLALAEAAKEAGANHFIYCSSTEAIGPINGGGDETSTPNPQYEYGVSKITAERGLYELQGTEPWVTVIRPSGVYGPGNVDDVSYWFVMSQVSGGILSKFIVGSGMTRIQFVHVSDVVQGFIRALENPDASKGETFIISENRAYTYKEVYGIIAELLGKQPPRLHIPPWLAKLSIAPVEFINRLTGRDDFMWHTATVDSVMSDRYYSVDKAAALLGYNPRYDLKTGLAETIEWYRETGYL
ncbi:MAG: NAD-dependent epimerase/dehydratase family protein [Candidatus Bathyarchaeota archaeon]|nr:NAD-dependent epimerase/dehydratase family protein [Candidatus Bathyarchaeota archaeon]